MRPLLKKRESIRAEDLSRGDNVESADHHTTKFCFHDALTITGYSCELNRLGLGTVN